MSRRTARISIVGLDFAIPTTHNRRRLVASRHVMLFAGVILGAAVLFGMWSHISSAQLNHGRLGCAVEAEGCSLRENVGRPVSPKSLGGIPGEAGQGERG